ncbi:MAG: ubiquinol-cytochrome C chaperone family protein [Caulobacter sp.]|nr:ubiquinol-cytochrome C chaperone family protein [Caulobacter sp.]
MFFKRFRKPRPAVVAGESLYSAAVAQARRPGLYTTLGAADTREGRFELYSLHVILLLDRLKGGPESDQARKAETKQALVDRFTRGLDDAFRELGVGDVAVPKRIKKLGEAFYGRARSADQAFDALPDTRTLQALLARTLFDGDDAKAAGMTDYIVRARQHLAAQPAETLLAGEVTWLEV